MFEKVKLVREVGVDKREGGGGASDPAFTPAAPDSKAQLYRGSQRFVQPTTCLDYSRSKDEPHI